MAGEQTVFSEAKACSAGYCTTGETLLFFGQKRGVVDEGNQEKQVKRRKRVENDKEKRAWGTYFLDAVHHGIMTKDPQSDVSLTQMRKASMPTLGNCLDACLGSISKALLEFTSYDLREETQQFRKQGGPMLNLLKGPPGVYVVATIVTMGTTNHRHVILVSKISEKNCPLGKLVNNYNSSKPLYIEEKDVLNKKTAKNVFKELFAQQLGHPDFAVQIAEIYELTLRV